MKTYACPCCGYNSFNEPPGSHEICEICFWEDDISQLRFPKMSGGANKISLIQGQKNFKNFGASDKRFIKTVRAPTKNDKPNTHWRIIDLSTDNIEEIIVGSEYGKTYPLDSTKLYYWSKKFWRK